MSGFDDVDDFQMTDGLVIQVGDDTITDYALSPLNAANHGRPWTRIEFGGWPSSRATVTARYGWTEVPDALKTATLIAAGRLFARRRRPIGALTCKQVDDVEYRRTARRGVGPRRADVMAALAAARHGRQDLVPTAPTTPPQAQTCWASTEALPRHMSAAWSGA